ncbi:hypothetical protein EDB83DRAFT_2404696 [Lactarius deliciosus]|nr:hypothetical protein EDB83DRAFT_2404696 [Lactarius deliciosus]
MMPNLHTLVFSGPFRRGCALECHAAEMNFWAVVAGTNSSLRCLEYFQPPRDVPATPMRSTADVRLYPLWSVSNLTSHSVKHAAFLRHPPSVVQFSRVLRNSPSLEVCPHNFSSSQLTAPQSLTLAVHDPSFDLHVLLEDMCLPHLRALALDILAPEAPSS